MSKLAPWRKWRLRYKILFSIFILGVGLFLSGSLLILNPQFQSYLKNKIITAVDKNLDANLTIDEISGNPFSYVRLRGIQFQGPFKTIVPENKMSAQEVVVRFSLWQLLFGKIGFSSIRVISPTVYLDTKAFISQTPQPSGGKKPQFVLNWLQLTNGNITVVYSDRKYKIQNANLTGSFSMDTSVTDIRVRDSSGLVEGMKIDQLRGRVSFSPTMAEVKSVRMIGNDVELNMDGKIIHGAQPQLDLHINSNKLPIEKVIAFFPGLKTTPVTGIAHFAIDLSGPLNKITGRGQLSAPKGQFWAAPYNQLLIKFSSQTSQFKIEDVSMNVFNGKFHATGEGQYISAEQDFKVQGTGINPATGDIQRSTETRHGQLPFTLNLSLQNIDVTQIPTIDTTLVGILNGQLKIDGNLMQVASLKGNGNVSWTNGKFKGVNDITGKSNIEIQADIIKFTNSRFVTLDGDATGSFSVQIPKRIEFNINWNSNNLALHKSLLRIPDIWGTGKGQLHGLSENLKPMLMDGKFQLESGHYGSIKFSHVDGTIFPDRRLELQGTNLVWLNDWPVDKASVQLKFGEKNTPTARRITFTQLNIYKGESRGFASGFVDAGTQQVQFSFHSDKARLVDLPAVQKQIPMFDLTMVLNGTVTGRTGNIIVTTQFNSPNFSMYNYPVSEKVTGVVSVNNKNLQFQTQGAGYSLRGGVDFHQLDPSVTISAELNNARLILPTKFAKTNNLHGNLNGSVFITGKNSNLRFSSYLQNVTSQFGEQSTIRFSSGTVFGQFQNGMQNGQLRWIPQNIFDSQHIVSLDNVILDITWKDRQSPDVHLLSPQGTIKNIPVSFIQAQFASKEPNLEIQNLSFKGRTGSFNMQGKIGEDSPSFHFDMIAAGMPIQDLVRFISPQANISLEGTANGQLNLSGKSFKLPDMDGQGKLTIANLKVGSLSSQGFLKSLKLSGEQKLISDFQIKNGRIQLSNSEIQFPKSTVKVNGWFDDNKQINLQFHGAVENMGTIVENSLGLATFDLILTKSWDHPKLIGNIQVESGKYDILKWSQGNFKINLDDIMKGSVDANFDNFEIGTETFEKANATLTLNDPNIELKNTQLTKKGSVSTIQGIGNISTGEFSGELTGSKLLVSRWLKTQSTGWIVDSELDFLSKVQGNYKKSTGSFEIEKLTARSGKSMIQLQDSLKIDWNPERWIIHPFVFASKSDAKASANGPSSSTSKNSNSLNGGTLKGEGIISVKNDKFQYYDMTVLTQNLSWPVVKGVDAIFDSRLLLLGDAAKPKLSGEIKFHRVDINAPVFMANQKIVKGSGRVVSLPAIPLQLDVTLSADSAIFLRNELLDLQAKGWIKLVTDANDELQITHELKTLNGFILYRNRKFPITKAEVTHTDPRVFNPYIDALAETRVRSIDIFLRVQGTLNEYDIALSSDPSYPQTDIFALLATGRTAEELRSPAKTDSISQLAAGYASEQIINTLGSPVVKAMRIDKVSVEYDEVDNEEKLKVEKALTKKLSVGYTAGLSKEPNSGGQLEYKLNKNLSAVGRIGVNSVSKEASGALDLEFRIPTK